MLYSRADHGILPDVRLCIAFKVAPGLHRVKGDTDKLSSVRREERGKYLRSKKVFTLTAMCVDYPPVSTLIRNTGRLHLRKRREGTAE